MSQIKAKPHLHPSAFLSSFLFLAFPGLQVFAGFQPKCNFAQEDSWQVSFCLGLEHEALPPCLWVASPFHEGQRQPGQPRATSAPSHKCSRPWWQGESRMVFSERPRVGSAASCIPVGLLLRDRLPLLFSFVQLLPASQQAGSGPGVLSGVRHQLGSQASFQGVFSKSLCWAGPACWLWLRRGLAALPCPLFNMCSESCGALGTIFFLLSQCPEVVVSLRNGSS